MPPPQKPPGEQITVRGTFHIVTFLAQSHASCITVFIRHSFGIEALAWNGLGAFVLLLLCAGSSRDMAAYFGLWFIALLAQRTRSIWLDRQGRRQHSRYSGWPWLAMNFAKTEGKAKLIEIVLCLAVAIVMGPLSETVSKFLLWGCFSLAFVQFIEWHSITMQVRRMRDAEIEMQQAAERFRGDRRDY